MGKHLSVPVYRLVAFQLCFICLPLSSLLKRLGRNPKGCISDFCLSAGLGLSSLLPPFQADDLNTFSVSAYMTQYLFRQAYLARKSPSRILKGIRPTIPTPSLSCPGHILDNPALTRSISNSLILPASWTKSILHGISIRK